MKVSIYAIKNPLTDKVFYVGASYRPKHRFREHYYGGAWKWDTPRYQEMRDLRLKKVMPELIILAEVEQPQAKQCEQYWINYYISIGHELSQMKTSAYGINTSKQYRMETRKRLL